MRSTNAATRQPSKVPSSRLAAYLHLGLLTQCVFCRCYRHDADPSQWDAVPEFEQVPPAPVSHGLCRPCAQLFYPGVLEECAR